LISILTIIQRRAIADKLKQELFTKFDVDRFQVFIFGSFLTDDYSVDSDVDIGIYSEDIRLRNDVYVYVQRFFKKFRIKADIIEMDLSEKMYINISIMVYGEGLTDFCPNYFIDYIKRMVDIWGYDPVSKLVATGERAYELIR
jgi:Nucleotidyltransferase domain.